MLSIGVPFGIWLAFSWKFGLLGLWMGLTVAQAWCAFWGVWFCARTDWDNEVVKVQERLVADQRKLEMEHA